MKLRNLFNRGSAALATAVLALAAAVPAVPAQAAGPINVVSSTTTPSGCGIYDTKPGLTVYPDLSSATAVVSTGTIYVCPGTYAEGAEVLITGSKLAIKQAVPGQRPEIQVKSGVDNGIHITDATGITVDGLLVNNATFNDSLVNSKGIRIDNSTAIINNMALYGPSTAAGAMGVYIDETAALGSGKLQAEKISNTYITGYSAAGIDVVGAAKLSVSAVTIDGTDSGRVTPDNTTITGGAAGIVLDGQYGNPTPTGAISKSTIRRYTQGIRIFNSSAVAVTGNFLTGIIGAGISVISDGTLPAQGNKITGNTVSSSDTLGINITQTTGSTPTILSTVISGNKVVAKQSLNPAVYGLAFSVPATTPPLLTATVSKNVLLGFASGNAILNVSGNANLKQTGNTQIP